MTLKQKEILLLSIVIIASLTAVTPLAFAQEDTEPDISDEQLEPILGDSIAEAIAIGGVGGASGALLAVIRVAGKNIKFLPTKPGEKPEPFLIIKFVTTIGVGFAIGMVLPLIGVQDAEALGLNFMILYFLTQVVFPVFKKVKWRV